jgi:hypothetical protein
LGCCGELSDLLHESIVSLLHKSSYESGKLALTRSFPAVDDVHADTEQ